MAGLAAVAALVALPAFGQEAEVAEEAAAVVGGEPGEQTVWILNTLLFLIGGFLVMFMAAGFAMLEAGLVRSRNVTMQCTKNIALFSSPRSPTT
jgi:ammonium transporter, Amt family